MSQLHKLQLIQKRAMLVSIHVYEKPSVVSKNTWKLK